MFSNITSKSPVRSHGSPPKQNFSLKSDDIPGAQPNRLIAVSKNILHYENKLITDTTKLANQLQRQPSLSKYDMLYGGEIANGSPTAAKHGKKHFGEHYNSEIHKTNALKRDEEGASHLLTFDYPRNLNTQDIPGAVPGTNKPKSVVNYDLAREIRRGMSVQKIRPEQEFQPRQVGDSLDRFQQSHAENHMRAKSTIHLDKVMSRPPSGGKNRILNDNMFADSPPRTREYEQRESLNSQVLPPSETNLYKPREEKPIETYSPILDSPTRNAIGYGGREFLTNSPTRGQRLYEDEQGNFSRDSLIGNRRNDTASNLLKSGLHDPISPVRAGPLDKQNWREPINDGRYSNSASKPTTGTSTESKKEEMKKIYTFDILSNKPTPKMLPVNARLPYKYAIPFDVEQFSPPKNLREISPTNLGYGGRTYNFQVLQQPTNMGREGEPFQSAPVGTELDHQKREQYLEMGHNQYNHYTQGDQLGRDML